MEFRAITLRNLDEMIALAVRPDQQVLVADNLYSIAQASIEPTAWCRGVYLDGTPVGFVSVKDRESGKRKYIWRFMIDARHQRTGVGRRLMERLLDELFADPVVALVELTVVREASGPEEFYRKCGFLSTEVQIGSEWQMVLTRSEYEQRQSAHSGSPPISNQHALEVCSTRQTVKIDAELNGRWIHEDEDSDVELIVDFVSGVAKVTASCISDGEKLEVVGLRCEGDTLCFHTVVPSSGFRARNRMRFLTPDTCELELTVWETWKKV